MAIRDDNLSSLRTKRKRRENSDAAREWLTILVHVGEENITFRAAPQVKPGEKQAQHE